MSSRTAGLPGLQHGGGAGAAASACHHHHHAERVSLMPGWHEDSAKARMPNMNARRSRGLGELLAEWWRRLRRP
jgi:hypothetical protein